jgi:hypothetical protein
MLLKLGGFVAALCATGALVAVTVPATGAYFSDAKAGSIAATAGHLTLDVTSGTTALSFDNLWPGAKTPQRIDYSISASGGTADVWLVFDKNSSPFQALTGKKSSPLWLDGGLGRYGYVAVGNSDGTLFKSGNLAYAASLDNTYQGLTSYPYSASSNGFTCSVDAVGHGGTDYENTAAVMPSSGTAGPACGIPDKILVAAGLGDGASNSVTITVGLNIAWTAQNVPVFPAADGTVPFKLVALQCCIGIVKSFLLV